MDLSGAFSSLFSFLTSILKWCLDGVLFILKNALYFVFDGLLTCITLFFTALDFSNFISSYAMSWAGIPSQMIWFINAVSIPAGITMISAAIGIRMAINLIPSWATRL